VSAKLPELPDERAARYERDYGLSAYDARHLVDHRFTIEFFEAACEAAGERARELAKPLANLALNDITAYVNAGEDIVFSSTSFTPARGVQLVTLLAADEISSKQAKEVFAAVLEEDKDPQTIVEERGMKQVSDTGAIEAVVDQVLADNPDKVEQYKGGKTGLIGFFVGQCMKAMKGQGNPKLINELLAQKLDA
jgi:aspartyl-tRNA(Asn)/glutamyl-tRNA(Gln) amidotransferase subunit B